MGEKKRDIFPDSLFPLPFVKRGGAELMEKTIHYCWFGGGELTETAKRSIGSWERYAPGFTIKRWDESCVDVNAAAWTRAAYRAQKWAFVSDYVRFKVLYEHGGIYMDVGTELIKSIEPLLTHVPFTAIEQLTLTATTGLIVAVEPHDALIGKIIDYYQSIEFKPDPEFLRTNTVNEIFTRQLEERGFRRVDEEQRVDDWLILESKAFNPIYGFGGYHIKKETYSIHHSSGSWVEPKFKVKRKFIEKWAPFIGRRSAQILGRVAGELTVDGVVAGTRNLLNVATKRTRKR